VTHYELVQPQIKLTSQTQRGNENSMLCCMEVNLSLAGYCLQKTKNLMQVQTDAQSFLGVAQVVK